MCLQTRYKNQNGLIHLFNPLLRGRCSRKMNLKWQTSIIKKPWNNQLQTFYCCHQATLDPSLGLVRGIFLQPLQDLISFRGRDQPFLFLPQRKKTNGDQAGMGSEHFPALSPLRVDWALGPPSPCVCFSQLKREDLLFLLDTESNIASPNWKKQGISKSFS